MAYDTSIYSHWVHLKVMSHSRSLVHIDRDDFEISIGELAQVSFVPCTACNFANPLNPLSLVVSVDTHLVSSFVISTTVIARSGSIVFANIAGFCTLPLPCL